MSKKVSVPAAERIFGKAKKALLVKVKQGSEIKNFRIHKERIVVGTVSSADVRLMGDGISPIHAVIELDRETGECTIYDLASDTGVFLNGTNVVTGSITTGDEVTLGRLTLRFFVEDSEVIKPKASTSAVSPQMEELGDLMQEGDDLRALLDPSAPVLEIFDYSTTQKRAVEVVMTWSGSILDIAHFTKEKEITVGSDFKANAHFAIPPVLASSRFVIAENLGDECVIHVDPTMRGVVQKQGQVRSIKEMGLSRVSLTRDDFAKVSIGDVDFYFSHTQAPPRLKNHRIEKDPLLFKLLSTSLILSLAVSFLLKNATVAPTVEAEKVPERLATVLYQPEKYQKLPKWMREPPPVAAETPPPPKPEETKTKTQVTLTQKPVDPNKPIPKVMDVGSEKATQKGKKSGKESGAQKAQSMAKEGAGARAKGKEGERGSKNAPASNEKQKVALRPSAQGGQGKGGGNSEVGDIGNIDALKGATSKIENLLSGSSSQLGKGGSNLQGFGAFTTQGQGGLALANKGTGGGGNADSLGGLADKGKGGGRVGTGLGAAGTGTGFVGGKARVDIRSGGPEETVVMGAIDTDAIMAVLNQHRDEFRLCYEREINAENPDLRGTVGMSFEIGSSGRVTQAGITSTTLKHANTERCVVQVLKRIQFPSPKGGGVVEVRYAIKYSPIGG